MEKPILEKQAHQENEAQPPKSAETATAEVSASSKATVSPAALPSTPVPTAPAKPTEQPAVDTVKIAKIISLVLHPFIVSPLSIVLILWLDTGSLLSALGWALLCAAFVVLPALLYLRDKLNKKAYTDADVSVREHRYGFYLFGGACMVACFGTLLWLDAPSVLIAGFVTALVALVVSALINRFWTKVSIHTGAMAGVATAAAFFSWPLAIVLGLGTVLVGWARLVTERHTLEQAVVAFGVAVVCVVAVFGPML